MNVRFLFVEYIETKTYSEIPNLDSLEEVWQYFDLEHVETLTEAN